VAPPLAERVANKNFIALIIAANASGNLALFSVNTKTPISPISGLQEIREHSEEGVLVHRFSGSSPMSSTTSRYKRYDAFMAGASTELNLALITHSRPSMFSVNTNNLI
jgi:hypothetical protein